MASHRDGFKICPGGMPAFPRYGPRDSPVGRGLAPAGQLQICLAVPSQDTAPPTCHPEPKAKDLAQEGTDTEAPVHEILRLCLRMTGGVAGA